MVGGVCRCSSPVQCAAGETTCSPRLGLGLECGFVLSGQEGRFHLPHRPRYWLILTGLKRQGGTHAASCAVSGSGAGSHVAAH